MDKIEKIKNEIRRHISIADNQLQLFGKEDERNRIMWGQQKKVCELLLTYIESLSHNENLWKPVTEIPKYPCDILYLAKNGNMFLFKYINEIGQPNDRETPYFSSLEGGKWCYCKDLI